MRQAVQAMGRAEAGSHVTPPSTHVKACLVLYGQHPVYPLCAGASGEYDMVLANPPFIPVPPFLNHQVNAFLFPPQHAMAHGQALRCMRARADGVMRVMGGARDGRDQVMRVNACPHALSCASTHVLLADSCLLPSCLPPCCLALEPDPRKRSL